MRLAGLSYHQHDSQQLNQRLRSGLRANIFQPQKHPASAPNSSWHSKQTPKSTSTSSSYYTKLSQSAFLSRNLFSSSSLTSFIIAGLLELSSWLNSPDKTNSSLNFSTPQRASSGVSRSKSFIVRSFLRYQVKRNEGPNGNCCQDSGIDIIGYCSVISTKLRCRLNLPLTFDGTH